MKTVISPDQPLETVREVLDAINQAASDIPGAQIRFQVSLRGKITRIEVRDAMAGGNEEPSNTRRGGGF